MEKFIKGLVAIVIALPLCYFIKHIPHVKCVEGALEMHCKRSYANFKQIESVDVPWWNPFSDEKYNCSAKLVFANETKDIVFVAKRASALNDLTKDDWDVNFGFWGWLGDDYRIFDVKAK